MGPRCGVSRQKREPQPPSGCQGGWQEGASPPGVSWETVSSPEKGHLEIKFLPLCVCTCVGRERERRNLPSPLCSLSLGKASLGSSFHFLPKLQPPPQKQHRLCWVWVTSLRFMVQVQKSSGLRVSTYVLGCPASPCVPGQHTCFLGSGFLLCN